MHKDRPKIFDWPPHQVGGLFGLMLGFSLVSFIEILYWLTGRLARNCLGKSSDSDEGLTVAELGNARKVRKAEVGLAKVLEVLQ